MPLTDFQVCDGDLPQAWLDEYLTAGQLAVDTETMGLVLHRDRLCLVQLCDEAGRVTMVRIPQGSREAPHLATLLTAPQVEKVFHFARFDLGTLAVNLGIAVTPVFCTKIASKLVRTYTNRHGLKDVIQELCGVELDKSAQSSDWGAVSELSPQQLAYAANDVRYLLAARHKLEAMLRRENRWPLAQRCFQALSTLVELDSQGFSGVFEHQ
ncbi:MAG: ribonuclease D [Synechococcales cyanobacterium]